MRMKKKNTSILIQETETKGIRMNRKGFLATCFATGLAAYAGIPILADPAGGVFVEDQKINALVDDFNGMFLLGIDGNPKINGYTPIIHSIKLDHINGEGELMGSFDWGIKVKSSNYYLGRERVREVYGVSTKRFTVFGIGKDGKRKAFTLNMVAWYDHEPLIYKNGGVTNDDCYIRGYTSRFKIIGIDEERPKIEVAEK